MSAKKMSGGPAFPVPSNGLSPAYEGGVLSMECSGSEGMTLRDYFAAKAMEGMVAGTFQTASAASERSEAVATFSYKIADAMLAARTKG